MTKEGTKFCAIYGNLQPIFISHDYPREKELQICWLAEYPWLIYLNLLDGAFYLPCLLFGRWIRQNCHKLNKLFKMFLRCWVTARKGFNDHKTK